MHSTIIQWLGSILAIVVVDLALSGDNALVIGAAASKLNPTDRRRAITFGGAAAATLRIALTFVAVYLLQIPLIKTVGGLAVFVIALLLLHDTEEDVEEGNIKHAPSSLLRACITIVIADISMSIDNVLAIAALARGNYVLLILGLLFSIVLLMAASSVIAYFIQRYPILIYIAGGVLAWTGASMLTDDKALQPLLDQIQTALPISVTVVIPLIFLAAFLAWAAREWSHSHPQTTV